jgi:hypothetical protein
VINGINKNKVGQVGRKYWGRVPKVTAVKDLKRQLIQSTVGMSGNFQSRLGGIEP